MPKTDDLTLVLTNRHKIFWPEEGYTKGDLLDYYREIAPVMLPYLKDRPQILHRHVDGHQGKEFFQRISRGQPSWVQTASIALSGGRQRTFVLCQDWPTLLWMANFGCVELLPWNARVSSVDWPDWLVIDLDPQDVPFRQVVECAQVVRKLLDRAGVASCCKTSGKRGLHVFVPLGGRYHFQQAKVFGDIICRLVNAQLPGTTCLDHRPEHSRGKIYLDHTRNARGQSMAAPYGVRPWPGATVSAPLKWSEVKRGLDPAWFTIKTLPKRLEKVGDLWQPLLGEGIDLLDCLERLSR
jgi:bifunctional non-homologous end joining protein LigD